MSASPLVSAGGVSPTSTQSLARHGVCRAQGFRLQVSDACCGHSSVVRVFYMRPVL